MSDRLRKGADPMIWQGGRIADAVTPNSEQKASPVCQEGFSYRMRCAISSLPTVNKSGLWEVEVTEHAQHGSWRSSKVPTDLTSGGSNAELGIAGHSARGAIQGHAGGVHCALNG